MPTPSRSTIVVVLLVGLALSGAGVSGVLLHGHAGGWDREAGGASALLRLCEPEEMSAATCVDVVNSGWGVWTIGMGAHSVAVPTSFIGLAYFLLLAIWFGMNGRIPAEAGWLWRVTLVYLLWGAAASVTLVGVMGLVLSAWCKLCLIAHGINVAIMIVTVLWWRAIRRDAVTPTFSGPAFPLMAYLRLRLACGAVVLSAMTIVVLWFYYDASTAARRQWRKLSDLRAAVATLQDDPGFLMREYAAQPAIEIPLRDDASTGSPVNGTAIPTLTVFTDLDSGPCRCFESRRRNLIEPALGGRIRVEYHHLPHTHPQVAETLVEGNPRDRPSQQRFPMASLAVEAARLQGGESAFATMRYLLFKDHSRRNLEALAEFAEQAGLDVDRFFTDMESAAVHGRVREEIELARRLGVRSVPAAFLQGRRVPELCMTSETFWTVFAESYATRPADDVCTPALSRGVDAGGHELFVDNTD